MRRGEKLHSLVIRPTVLLILVGVASILNFLERFFSIMAPRYSMWSFDSSLTQLLFSPSHIIILGELSSGRSEIIHSWTFWHIARSLFASFFTVLYMHKFVLIVTISHWLLLVVAFCYCVLRLVTACYWLLLCVTACYCVLRLVTGCCCVLLVLAVCYGLLLCVTVC